MTVFPISVLIARSLPPDWIVLSYLTITGILICIFNENFRRWKLYLFTHLAFIAGILFLALAPHEALPLWAHVVHDLYPLATIPAFYWLAPPLTQMVFQRYFDHEVIEWEERLFKGQPSVYLSARFPSKALSELLHLCYLSYYVIIFGFATLLYLQGRREVFREVVFAEVLTFHVCLICFIFMPVVGPRYRFEKIKGRLADGLVFRFVHAILESASAKGTAFPSSHCALATIVVLYAARHAPIAFAVLGPLGTGLVISTVYGRFHYAVDALAGVVLAVLLFGLAPHLFRALS